MGESKLDNRPEKYVGFTVISTLRTLTSPDQVADHLREESIRGTGGGSMLTEDRLAFFSSTEPMEQAVERRL